VAHVAPNARARVPNFASGFSKNERAPFPAFVLSFAFETRVAPVADARSRTTNTQGQIESVTESKRSRSAEPVAGAGTSIPAKSSARERTRATTRSSSDRRDRDVYVPATISTTAESPRLSISTRTHPTSSFTLASIVAGATTRSAKRVLRFVIR
jgi:hypothetical protein